MARTNCPSDSDLWVAVNRPQGLGGFNENVRPVVSPVVGAINDAVKQQQVNASLTAQRDQLAGSIRADMLPGEALTGQQKLQLGRLSRRMLGWVEDAAAGVEARQQDFMDAWTSVSGATTHDASLALNITNAISRATLKKEAHLDKWAVTNVGTKGSSVKDNPIVQAQEAMRPKIAGRQQKYLGMVNEWHKAALPYARRVHMDPETFMDALGHYAVMRHIPEANAHLIQTWEADMVVDRAAGRIQAANETAGRIDALRNYMDSDAPPEDLMSAGYTNAEAAKFQTEILSRLDITPAQAEELSNMFSSFVETINTDRRAAGAISPEVQARWPEFQNYVPLRSAVENTTGPVNMANAYNPGAYYARQGSSSRPDSAYHSLIHYGRRAAFEWGMRDLGLVLAAAQQSAQAQGRSIGLVTHAYSKISAALNGPQGSQRKWAERLMDSENGGGIVVDLPNPKKGRTEKTLITFDQAWVDPRTKLTGGELNQALMGNVKSAQGYSFVSGLTSMYGQLNTRFNPAFALPNAMRDNLERPIHMMARDYRDVDGNVVKGSSLLGRYFLNIPGTLKMLFDWKRGAIDPGSTNGQLMSAYVDNGLHQEYTRGKNTPRMTLEDVVEGRKAPSSVQGALSSGKTKGLLSMLSRFDENTRARVIEKLDTWNDVWNNVAPLAQYKTMREARIDARDAAHGTLEIFDLYQSGTIVPMLSMVFPYVKPTFQTGKAMARSFGLAPNAQGQFQMNYRGLAALGGAYAAITALLPFFKDSMGEDPETGVNRFDLIPIGDLQRFMPLGLGDGSFAKMYLGFGPSRFAATAAVGMDRVQRGLMTPEAFGQEMLFAVAKEVSPTDWPEFSMKQRPLEWLAQALSPTILRPGVDTAINTNFRGGKLVFDRADDTPRALGGRLSTPAAYHKFAETVLKEYGVDVAPEQWKNLFDGYAVGPLRILRGVLGDGATRAGGVEQSATEELGPWLSALGMTMFYGKTANVNRDIFYSELNRYNDIVRREGIKLSSTTYGNNKDKRRAYQTARLEEAGWVDEDIEEYLDMRDAQLEIRKLNDTWKNKILPERWFDDEDGDMTQFTSDFEELALRHSEIFTQVVNESQRYGGGG